MLPILLAALSAVVWGTGDFCGGKATQRSNALAVTVLSQLAGLPVLALCVVLLPGGTLTLASLGWGAAAGFAGFIGILLLYRGLASGHMTVFAPVTAVTAALVPLIVGLVMGERPGVVALLGAVCALAAIALVSASGSGNPAAARLGVRLIGLALGSGAMFGIFFSLIGEAGGGTGMWPLVGLRAASLLGGVVTALVTRTSLRIGRAAIRWALLAGPFDAGGNALYVVAATSGGLLSLVAPVSALYPVSTVLLAFAIDRERMRPVQLAGLGLAATALVLVAA